MFSNVRANIRAGVDTALAMGGRNKCILSFAVHPVKIAMGSEKLKNTIS